MKLFPHASLNNSIAFSPEQCEGAFSFTFNHKFVIAFVKPPLPSSQKKQLNHRGRREKQTHREITEKNNCCLKNLSPLPDYSLAEDTKNTEKTVARIPLTESKS